MDKATVESVMALAFELARIREQHGAQSGMYLSEVRALRAEAERLAAQAAPTEAEALRHLMGMGEAEIDAELLTSGIDPDDAVKRAVRAIDGALATIRAERRAIEYGDIVHTQVIAMRAAVVAAKLEGPEVGIKWIENTLFGPGHYPDIEAAREIGGAQAMFDKEMAEHEAFRAAHPAPVAAQPSQAPVVQAMKATSEPLQRYTLRCPKDAADYMAKDSDGQWVKYDDLKADRASSGATTQAVVLAAQRPQNCGTGHCSCIECVVGPSAERATVVQAVPAGEYPPLPEPAYPAIYAGLGRFSQRAGYTAAQLRAYVDADRASSGATTQAIPFSKDSWQHAVDNQLVAFGRTSQEFANPHEALAWLAIMNMELGQSNAGATTQAVRMLTTEEIADCCNGLMRDNSAIETWIRRSVKKAFAVNAGRTIPADGKIGGAA